MRKVVLVSGKAGSGKTSLCHQLCLLLDIQKNRTTNSRCLFINFADPLKLIAKEWFNWSGHKNVTGRNILQTVGQGMREVNQYTWVNLIYGIAKMRDPEILVIGDCRYKNELAFFITKFGKENCVTVNLTTSRPSKLTKKQLDHQSEHDLDDYAFDLVFENNTPADRQRAIIEIMTRLE